MPDFILGSAPTERNGDDAPEVLTSKKSSPQPEHREGEDELVEWVEGLHKDAEDGRREQCGDPEDWDEALGTYWGDQWKGASLPTFKVPIVLNEIKSLALQELSDLTDSRLNVFVEDAGGKHDQSAAKAMQASWTRYFWDLTMLSSALDAIIYPLGFLQSGFDPLAERGQGVVTLKARNPRSVYPDPDAETDDDLKFFILEDIMDLVSVHATWPETGPSVEAEAAWSIQAEGQRNRPSPRAGGSYVGPLYSGMPGVVEGWKKARVKVLTCVVEDGRLKDEFEKIVNDAGVEELKLLGKRPEYPDRRMIQIANKRVLYDGNNQYQGAPILTRVMLQPTVHAYWPAGSIVKDFTAVQQGANKADSMVLENIMRNNAGQGFADADSGIDPSRMVNIPGQWTLIKPGSKVDIKYPNAQPQEAVALGERLRGFIRALMGYPTSRTGAGTHGNVAAELAETEISQSMGITRLRGRLLHLAAQKAVEMLFARMAQFYTTPRHIPYLVGQHWEKAEWLPIVKPEQYAVLVDPASFAVRSKTMMQRLYFTLARMNKMPTARLLKALEVPDAEAIAGELKQELILMALARMKQPKGKGRA